MERIMENGEIYSEKKLAELVEFATDDLELGVGYQLELEGVQTDTITYKELAAFFGVEMDDDEGATIRFSYDDLTNSLKLKQLILGTKGVSGKATFHSLSTGDYLPILTIADREYPHKDGPMSSHAMAASLQRFGIGAIPECNTPAFAAWQSEVLSTTKAWRINERTEIPVEFSETTTQSVILAHESVVKTDTLDIVSIRSIQQRMDIQIDTTTSRIEAIYEVFDESTHRIFRHHLFRGDVDVDPFVLNATNIHQADFKTVPVTEENYGELERSLKEIIHLRKSS